MRRLLFVMFCLIAIVPAFAVDDDTLNVYINITESSAIAFTDGEYTLAKGDLISYGGPVDLNKGNHSVDNIYVDNIYASAVTNANGQFNYYLKFSALKRTDGNEQAPVVLEYLPLSIAVDGVTTKAEDDKTKTIKLSETAEDSAKNRRAISRQLTISVAKNDFDNATAGSYSTDLILTVDGP